LGGEIVFTEAHPASRVGRIGTLAEDTPRADGGALDRGARSGLAVSLDLPFNVVLAVGCPGQQVLADDRLVAVGAADHLAVVGDVTAGRVQDGEPVHARGGAGWQLAGEHAAQDNEAENGDERTDPAAASTEQ